MQNGKLVLDGLPPEIRAALQQGGQQVVVQQPMNDQQILILAASNMVGEISPQRSVELAIEIFAEVVVQCGPGMVNVKKVVDRVQEREQAVQA